MRGGTGAPGLGTGTPRRGRGSSGALLLRRGSAPPGAKSPRSARPSRSLTASWSPTLRAFAPGPRPCFRASRSARGYTLIEVIVAFAILALAMVLLLGTLSGSTRQIRYADDAGRAALHAQSLLDQIGVGEALAPGHREGDIEDGRYRWDLDVQPYRDPAAPEDQARDQPQDLAAPQLMRLLLTVRWGEEPRQRLQVQTLRLVTPDSTAAVAP